MIRSGGPLRRTPGRLVDCPRQGYDIAMIRFIKFADSVSAWFGKAFAWTILFMTFGMAYEVIVRYLLNSPTAWSLDVSFIMYGTLFMMGGAYTLSRGGHVRGDFLYRLWAPRTQAKVELVLYFLFFFPGVIALVIAGWHYGYDAYKLQEVSVNSPAGIPVWQLKMLIPFGAGLLVLQGIAEVLRCILCIRNGQWPERLQDVEELEKELARQHAKEEQS
jgi:TRAP-type mannitol/chloroaromatic compound transport system permease small subunit